MCIRDRAGRRPRGPRRRLPGVPGRLRRAQEDRLAGALPRRCLLYTSDAADERSSVDLGGRRIIKKKKKAYNGDEEHYRGMRTTESVMYRER